MSQNEETRTPTAAGCTVTKADTNLIIASVACYGAFAVYGACVSALGASLPSLAEATGRSKSAFGIAFTTRGIGYLIGTLVSAWILSFKNLSISKQFMTCAALAITGVATGIISDLRSFPAVLALFFFQGVGFGGIDVMANCVMPELWGLRVQPWMQALHSCFGVGAIIGPALVGSIGYKPAFIIIALFSFVPLVGLLGVYLNGLKNKPLHELEDDAGLKNDIGDGVETSDTLSTEGKGESTVPVPLLLKLLIAGFYFVYVGVESGYAGWIPSFALDEDVTGSVSQAAYLSSYFWAALTGGRLLAIVVAVYASATSMLRFQLVLTAISAILILFLAGSSYSNAAGVSAFFGFALSSVFPLAMTIVSDYGFAMDADTTTLFMVAATLGEAVLPVCMGLAIAQTEPSSLLYITVASAAALCFIYFGMHYLGGQNASPARSANVERGIEMESSSQETTSKQHAKRHVDSTMELQQCV
jgi:fucose permease